LFVQKWPVSGAFSGHAIVAANMTFPAHLVGLNAAQRQAVLHTGGPLLVLAGAGAGKTRVIAHRIVNLIHQGVAPERILAVTFTNKAASEMRARVSALVKEFPPTARAVGDGEPVVSTFHSLGVRILREFSSNILLKRHFAIYDRSDSARAVREAIVAAGHNPKEFEPRRILSVISRAKGDGHTLEIFGNLAQSHLERVAGAVWERYDALLRKEGALDFDDLLLQTVRLLEGQPSVLETLTERYRHIHVDEYQDTNRVQFRLIKLLGGKEQNVCVVGDLDQNIYSWRGASINNVLQFERTFAKARTIMLNENYRSTKTIVAAAGDVIKKNRQRIEKEIFTSNEHGEPLTLFAADTGANEAEYVSTQAAQLIKNGTPPSGIAVLYRTNFQSRALEDAFLSLGVPYQLLGVRFFERKEVKDVLSYLRLSLNPESTADLARVINMPQRGIGKVTVLKLIEGRRGEIREETAKRVTDFYALMEEIRVTALTKSLPDTIKFIMTRGGLEAELKARGGEENEERLENLRELVTLAGGLADQSPEAAALALLERAALESDQDELKKKDEHDAVRLMTVHAAKGLEFSSVFITGLEEGLFPHERLDDARVDHEEERRLFYVALTRARRRIFLTYARRRTIFGVERVAVPSSFLSDISGKHLVFAEREWGNAASGRETTIYLD
jgi:DNA helicase-2/ATP-dependent DNA helicase PcrA